MLLSFWPREDSSHNKVMIDLLLEWIIVPPLLYVLYVGRRARDDL